jgi:hypothetical protein
VTRDVPFSDTFAYFLLLLLLLFSPEKEAQTSHVPFWALLSGRQSWAALAAEIKGLNATVAIACALLLARRGR